MIVFFVTCREIRLASIHPHWCQHQHDGTARQPQQHKHRLYIPATRRRIVVGTPCFRDRVWRKSNGSPTVPLWDCAQYSQLHRGRSNRNTIIYIHCVGVQKHCQILIVIGWYYFRLQGSRRMQSAQVSRTSNNSDPSWWVPQRRSPLVEEGIAFSRLGSVSCNVSTARVRVYDVLCNRRILSHVRQSCSRRRNRSVVLYSFLEFARA